MFHRTSVSDNGLYIFTPRERITASLIVTGKLYINANYEEVLTLERFSGDIKALSITKVLFLDVKLCVI